jgi:hypothetical protein
MASFNFSVRYYYFKIGGPKTSTSFSGIVADRSEILVIQKLKEKHPGKEIELQEGIRWK